MARKNSTKAKPQARRTTPAKTAKKPAKPRAKKEPTVFERGLVQKAPGKLPDGFIAQDNPAQVQTY